MMSRWCIAFRRRPPQWRADGLNQSTTERNPSGRWTVFALPTIRNQRSRLKAIHQHTVLQHTVVFEPRPIYVRIERIRDSHQLLSLSPQKEGPGMNQRSADQIRMKSSSIHSPHASSPSRLGYRLPAEWEPHEATWVSWPHRESTWTGGLGPVGKFYAEVIAAITEDEMVRVSVADAEMETRARAILASRKVNTDRIHYHHCPTDDAWIRSYATMIVKVRDADPAFPPRLAVDWRFNGWGGSHQPCDRDNAMSHSMSRTLGIPEVAGGMVLEGGAVEVNGHGTLLTTRSCLLNSNRNADFNREHIEQRLKEMLGIDQLLWLESDPLIGDETDGHIDNVARFVNETTVVAAVETDVSDANYVPLQINVDRLRSIRFLDGRSLDVKVLPMPPAIVRNGRRAPASYTQYYLTNRSILVPQFNAPTDAIASDTLARCFPNRKVVGIDCRNIVESRGGLHHLVQQIPA